MCRLERDRTAEPVSRDKIPRRERGLGNIDFSCSADPSRIGNLSRLIFALAVCDAHTYLDTPEYMVRVTGAAFSENPLDQFLCAAILLHPL